MERHATCCDLPRQRNLSGVFVIVEFKLGSNVCAFCSRDKTHASAPRTYVSLITTNACAFVWPVLFFPPWSLIDPRRSTFGYGNESTKP